MLPSRKKELGKAAEQEGKQADMGPCATPGPFPLSQALQFRAHSDR